MSFLYEYDVGVEGVFLQFSELCRSDVEVLDEKASGIPVENGQGLLSRQCPWMDDPAKQSTRALGPGLCESEIL